jgi:hypothetical protein
MSILAHFLALLWAGPDDPQVIRCKWGREPSFVLPLGQNVLFSAPSWTLAIREKDIHSFIHLFIYFFIHPSTHPSICPSVHPSIHPSIHLATHPSSVYSLKHTAVCSEVGLFWKWWKWTIKLPCCIDPFQGLGWALPMCLHGHRFFC